jgi:hypothetical protein
MGVVGCARGAEQEPRPPVSVTLAEGGRTLTLKKAEVGIVQMVDQYAKGDKHPRRDLFSASSPPCNRRPC